MQTLKGKKLLLIGFTLFSMFFGAGNLIFPPYLGAQAGTNLWPAFAGFAVSAIVLLFTGCLVRPVASGYGIPSEAYASLPATQGILDGYQTMDAIAGLNFGAVIALNIQALGITEPQEIEYAHLEHRSCRAAHPFAPPAQRHLPHLHRIDLPLVFAQEISASFGLPVLHRPDRRAEHSSRSAAWYPLFAGKFASSVFSRFRLGGSGCCGDPPRLCSLISCETKRKCGLLPHFLFSF